MMQATGIEPAAIPIGPAAAGRQAARIEVRVR